MDPVRPLRDVFADLASDEAARQAHAADPEGFLASYGHPDLPGDLVGEAIASYADTAPPELAEHLAPLVAAYSPVPELDADLDGAAGLDLLATAPAEDLPDPGDDPGDGIPDPSAGATEGSLDGQHDTDLDHDADLDFGAGVDSFWVDTLDDLDGTDGSHDVDPTATETAGGPEVVPADDPADDLADLHEAAADFAADHAASLDHDGTDTDHDGSDPDGFDI